MAQGGVTSPLMNMVYVANVVNNINEAVKALQCAGDIVVYEIISDVHRSTSILKNSISTITTNLFNLGLEVSTSEIEFIHFNKAGIIQVILKLWYWIKQ